MTASAISGSWPQPAIGHFEERQIAVVFVP